MTGDAVAVLALVVALATTVRWFVLARRVALPESRTGFVAAWLLGAALGAAALVLGTSGWFAGSPARIAILVGLFLPFTVSISRQVATADGLALGAPLLAFQALDENEAVFDSKQLEGKPVLLKFFRGHW